MSYFALDDIKLTSSFTLNLGLRWDYFEWPHDIYGRMGTFDGSVIAEGPYGTPTAGQGYTGFTLARDYARLNPNHPIPAG
jgi:outer membrane receptor for monomeric catechols